MRAEPARTGGYWPTQYGYANLHSCRLVLGRGLSETSTVCSEDDASLRGGRDSGAGSKEGAPNVRPASLERRDHVTPDDSLRKNLALRVCGAL